MKPPHNPTHPNGCFRPLVGITAFLLLVLPATSCTAEGDAIPRHARVFICRIQGNVFISRQGKEIPARIWQEVVAGTMIKVASGSALDLGLPNNTYAKYSGPVSIQIQPSTQTGGVVTLQPPGQVVRGERPALEPTTEMVRQESMRKTVFSIDPDYWRGKRTDSFRLIAPKGVVFSSTPTIRLLDRNARIMTMTFSPSDDAKSGAFAFLPPERIFKFPTFLQLLKRGVSYCIPEINCATFTVLSSTVASTIQRTFDNVGHELAGMPEKLARVSILLSLGLPCDALDVIDDIDQESGTSTYLLSLRRKAYTALVHDVTKEIPGLDTFIKKIRKREDAQRLLEFSTVRSQDGGFEFSLGVVSDSSVVPIPPGNKFMSNFSVVLAARLLRDLLKDEVLELFLLDSRGGFKSLWSNQDKLNHYKQGEIIYLGDWKLNPIGGLESFILLGKKNGEQGGFGIEIWEERDIQHYSREIINTGTAELGEKWSQPLNEVSRTGLKELGGSWAIIRIAHIP